MAKKKRVTESTLKDLFYDTVAVIRGQLNREEWAQEVDPKVVTNALRVLKDNNIVMDLDCEVEDDFTKACKDLPAFDFEEYAIN
jgi:hypothetical protein